MPGGNDPLYVEARRALLDALDALGSQLEAVTIVGAQAIYLHIGEGDLAVAPYTTDGDLSLAPASLSDSPTIAESMHAAGFSPQDQPGSWRSPTGIEIDLMVPSALGGKGSRGARLGCQRRRSLSGNHRSKMSGEYRPETRVLGHWFAVPCRSCEAWSESGSGWLSRPAFRFSFRRKLSPLMLRVVEWCSSRSRIAVAST